MKTTSQGSVSVMTLMLIMIVMISSAGAISLSYTTMARAKSDNKNTTAYSAAQAGMEISISNAMIDVQATKGVFLKKDFVFNETLGDLSSKPLKASGEIKPTVALNEAWVTSSATVDGRTSSIRVFLKAKDVGIWNNAIFAGSGASGQSINGNVDIRGSVHILGDGEPFIDLNGNLTRDSAETYTDRNRNGRWDAGEPFTDSDNNGTWTPAELFNDLNSNGLWDPPMTETDLNSSFTGNSGIQNHYAGLSNLLKMSVPTPPSVNGVETLFAELRVKNGLVGLSGSASVGVSGLVNGGSAKNTVDGTFVSAGFSGTKGDASVFSDNGTKTGYDVGNLGIKYPLISGIGAPAYKDVAGVTWATQEDYLNARSLTIPTMLVKSTTLAFSFGPDAYGNKVSFTPQTNALPAKLSITGIIKVGDGFQLGVKDSLTYSGSGTIFSPGNILIDGSLLPSAGLIFPTTTRIGFIAKKDLLLATGNGSAQLNLSGAFYAQGKVKSAKQNQVMGTFVGSYYDLGTNVPSIYQVPTLPKNMPPGMPGDEAYITLDIKSWRLR